MPPFSFSVCGVRSPPCWVATTGRAFLCWARGGCVLGRELATNRCTGTCAAMTGTPRYASFIRVNPMYLSDPNLACLYIYRVHLQPLHRDVRGHDRHPAVCWPLQNIRLYIRGLCTSQYYSWHATPPLLQPPVVFCNQYCAVYGFPPPPLFCHSTYNIDSSNIV